MAQGTRLGKRIVEATRARRGATVVLLSGLLLVISSASGLGARASAGGFSTNLAAEPGQNPMPSGVTSVPEDCKGIAPTNGSPRHTTQKQLNEGQGLIKPSSANSNLPGGTVHWLIKYNSTKKANAKSFDIRDCVVEFLPGNNHLAGVVAMIDTSPTGYGQIIVTGPGATPDSKGFDNVLDNAEFDFPNVNMPGEFDLSWVIPADAPPGALICNYAKDTGGETKGGGENRKAGACFTVAPPQTTTTTTVPSTTTTVVNTTTTTVPVTTTTVPVTTTTVPVTTTTVPVTTTTVPVTTTTVPVTTTTVPVTTTTVPVTTTTVPVTTTTTVPCESTTTTAGDVTTTTNPECETTTTTAPPETTTTTVPCETSTTVGGETTTTNPECGTTTTAPSATTTTAATVLGESFVKPSAGVASNTLARTGSDVRTELFWAGVVLMLGGFAGVFGERKRGASARG